MIIEELKHLLFQAAQFHNEDELICVYNQETGERIDIEYVDDTINGEIRLSVKGITND